MLMCTSFYKMYRRMSLSNYLRDYMSDTESGEITSTDEEEEIIQKPASQPKSTVFTLDFSAHLSASLSNVLSYHSIIFDIVDTNNDKSYNVTTGRFTAPFKGIYVFFITITSTEKLKASLCFMHKFNPVFQANVKEMEQLVEGYNTKTMAVVLSLEKGEKVWVMNGTKVSDVSQMFEPYYTSFSGGLVEKQSTL
ncbi:complement C1q tumor necrosis factor-related protein 3-like [Mercenaria mercenaria]|uniref:complement C1q tumor necrosis factor-related protein 3-like n=1 Tax=Mercenaria mercenaria TaxID=6596 RepID=UPI00234F6916|nr:complement C1q tumor necrosis factor-related protein 3-like [Mercenaria mercenaria]